jgi:hypothetical protein
MRTGGFMRVPPRLDQHALQDDFGVLGQQGLQVDRLDPDRHEHLAPQHAQQQRPRQAEHIELGIAGPHLAARLGGGHRRADRPQHHRDHVLVPDLGQFRKVARLADHHLGHRAQPALGHHLGDAGEGQADQVAERQRALGDEAGDGRQVGDDRLAHHRPEQVLLGLEIEIERALRDPGPGGDVVQPRGREALLGEHLQRRGDDLAGPGFTASSPLGLAGGHDGAARRI